MNGKMLILTIMRMQWMNKKTVCIPNRFKCIGIYDKSIVMNTNND